MTNRNNIIKKLNSILSEQTIYSDFNEIDITSLIQHMKKQIRENIENKYDSESDYYKEEVNSLNEYIKLCFEDEAITVINKFLGSKDDKYCWNFVTTFAFSSNLRDYSNRIKFDSYDASVESPDNIDELKYFMRQISFTILYTLIKEEI